MSRTEKFALSFSFLMRFILIIELIFSIVNQSWFILFLTSLGLILTFLPSLIERNYKIAIPLEFEVFLIFFLFASLYLGEVRHYYQEFWWWDIFLHTLSGIILGIIGFIIVYILNNEEKVRVRLAPGFVATFSFFFALGIGVLWEIIELVIDVSFGVNMQKGNLDTMTDLIVDAFGALLISIAGYFYLKKVKLPIIEHFVQKFRRRNRV